MCFAFSLFCELKKLSFYNDCKGMEEEILESEDCC